MNSLKFQDRLLGLQDNLLNFAYMLTANREEAKDLLQDTTLKALDNEDKYIDNVNFKGWVFTIMRNIFINNYRRVVRNQTIIERLSIVSARSIGYRFLCMWQGINITRLPKKWICLWAR